MNGRVPKRTNTSRRSDTSKVAVKVVIGRKLQVGRKYEGPDGLNKKNGCDGF